MLERHNDRTLELSVPVCMWFSVMVRHSTIYVRNDVFYSQFTFEVWRHAQKFYCVYSYRSFDDEYDVDDDDMIKF